MLLLLFLIYTIRTVRNTLYHLYWWDMKEWRMDRMKVHLTETLQGKQWMFGPLNQVKWLLIILYILPEVLFNVSVSIVLDWVVYGVYAFEAGKIIVSFTKDKRPDGVRPKIFIIFIGTIIFELLAVPLISFDFPLGLAFLVGDKLLPFIVFIQVWTLSIVYWFFKQTKIQMAREKLSSAKKLKVIGITGSYGKTTVKEFLYQILSKKYKTLKTEKSQNSDVAIAELILRTNLPDYDYFVCEIAAYHPGEIRSSTSILGDRIVSAVITGINQQHQSLFGSIERTRKSKYELIEATKQGGTVIVNAQSIGAKKMGDRARIDGYNIKYIQKQDLVKEIPKKTAPFFKINATLASEAAKSIGMKETMIIKAVKKLTLPEKTMNEKKNENITIINDTFNANPDSVYASLKYLKRKRGKKVLVLQPLIELGSYADKVHEKIGKLAGEICDHVILTNRNWNNSFMRGVSSAKNSHVVVSVQGELPRIKQGVMLFEGKEAEAFMIH